MIVYYGCVIIRVVKSAVGWGETIKLEGHLKLIGERLSSFTVQHIPELSQQSYECICKINIKTYIKYNQVY